ncbi:hypothetical protein PMZ80_006843 [Knufia obscura]|uniref:Major facilitator superfamily (MFS) profile domain-containing protein n=1 Tax=Knufia obscura TaxID=1635080 RepID=A0ABR0RJI6_9EURO|nr:hypothetical protein PMZ80_006843 [Knufia obscura]
MGFLFLPKITSSEERSPSITSNTAPPQDEKTVHGTTRPAEDQLSEEAGQSAFDKETQAGVKRVQALATVWSKSSLIAAYAFIWLIYVVTSLEEVIIRALNPYVTSDFSLHSLTAATGIMSYIIGGLTKIPIAKILDTWGRPQGMALTLFLWIVGFIMMAGCKNVETYAAAQVFSAVGAQGVSYCMTVFISDTSSLRNRGLMLAFATSPYIFTTFAGGPASESVLSPGGIGWRWGFGIFTLIIPAVVLPLIFIFWFNQRKAKKQGVLVEKHSKLTVGSLKRYAIEVDLPGILILAAGMALFLLPFSLYSYQPEGWQSPMVISMIVVGGVLLIFFAVYERFFAVKTFIPLSLLSDRTVFFGGMMFVFNYAASAIWGGYFYSMLQVVWALSVTEASYISSIFRVGQCLWCLGVGLAIRYSGRFKWLAVYVGMPFNMLAIGLMIYFRRSDQDIGFIALTQILVSFAGGTIVICGELAMMAPSDQQHLAVILAILNLFASIGSAIGGTISTTIWTSLFYRKLVQYMPAGSDAASTYASLVTQLSYEEGSPEREAINRAYGETQRYMLITSLCFVAIAYVCVFLWRDISVKNLKQVKGRVI